MDTIGTPFNERLRPMVKFFGNMFQGVRGNLKLLTDPRASQRFRNAPEDQQTIQDRLDRWNALSARFRTVLDKFFEPFVNFTAVRNAANTAEEFGNSIAHLAERMTPFGQKLIKGFGSLTKTIADNPKLLEFGIRFTGIALALTLIGGAVLSFLALLSGPAGLLAVFGLLATGTFALMGTFRGTEELFRKTAEEMSGLELVIRSVLELLGLVDKPADPTKKDPIGEGYTEHKTKLRTDLDKRLNDPETSGVWKALEVATFAVNTAVLSAAEPIAQLANNLGLPTYVPGQVMGPENAKRPGGAQRQGLNQSGMVGTFLNLATVGVKLPGNEIPTTIHANADPATKVDMLSDDYSFSNTDAKVEGVPADPDIPIISTGVGEPVQLFDPGGAFKVTPKLLQGDLADTGDTVDLVSPVDTGDTVDLVSPVDTGDTVDLVTPVAPEGTVDLVTPVDPEGTVDLVTPVDPEGTVDLVTPVDTEGTVDLVTPVDPEGTVDLVTPVDTEGTVDLVTPVDTEGTVDLVTPVDTVASDDSDLDVEPKKRRSRDPRRRQGYSEYTVTTVTQGKPVGDGSDDDGLSNLPLNNSGPVLFPNVLQPDASFHDPAPGCCPCHSTDW